MSHKSLISAVLVIIALCVISIAAQSGRRQTKVTPAPPVPTPTPEPTPTPKKDDEPRIGFFVGSDRQTIEATYPLYFYRAVVEGCASRLRSGSSASVDVSDRDLSRGEAIKKAKAENTTYVVLISFSLDRTSARSIDDVEIEYVVFEPVTAKVATSGRSYQNANRAGPVVIAPPGRSSTNSIYREQLLKRAGEDAAIRILKALHMNLPARR